MSAGTIFTELDLDFSKFEKNQQKLLQSATSASTSIEKNFQNLGVKSDAIYEAMRRSATNSLEMIKAKSTSTGNEIARAQEAHSAKMIQINEQQFGHQTSLIESAKKNWMGLTVAATAVYMGISKIANVGMDWARAAGEQQKAEAGLMQSMVAMGRYSDVTYQSLLEHAKALQKVTTFGDEATIAGMKFLMTYKQIPDEVMPRATSAMLDLAALMGGDTKNAANMLGKAAMGLSGELRRVGITIDEDVAKSGDFSKILGEIEQQVGGQARAIANTGIGPWEQLVNLWGDSKENLGELVLEITGGMLPAIRDWTEGVGVLAKQWKDFLHPKDIDLLKEQEKSILTQVKALEDWQKTPLRDLSGTATEQLASLRKQLAIVQKTIENDKAGVYDVRVKVTPHVQEEAISKAAQEAAKKATEEAAKLQTLKVDLYIKDEARKWAELEKYEKDYAAEHKKWDDDVYKSDMERFAKTEDENAKYFVDLKKEEDKKAKEEIECGEKRLTAERDVYKDLRGYDDQYYDASKALIDAQAAEYRKKGIDEVAVAAWVAEETRKAEIKKLEASDDFMDGVSAGFKRLEKEQVKWGQVGVASFKAMNSSMASTFSNVFEDAYKGDLKSIKDYSTTIWDSVRKKFFDTTGQMVTDAAMNDIRLLFKSEWTAGGSEVLGIINKVLGLASNIDWGSGAGSFDSGVGDWASTFNASHYQGGLIEGGPVNGSARHSGDHPGNDTVPAWLSPGEVVIRRTAVNSETEAILDYINKFGQPPQYAFGGRIMNQVTDTPGRGYFGFSDIANIATGGAYGAITGDYGDSLGKAGHILSDIWGSTHTAAIYDLYDAWKTSGNAGDIYGFIDRAMDPGGTVDPSLRAAGELMPQWMRDVAPMVGGIIGQLWGPWMAAAGAGAGAKIAGYDTKEAMRTASMAALMTWISGGGGGGADAAPAALANAAKSYATKWIINEALGAALGNPENGQMSVSYMGADDNGVLSRIAAAMKEIAPRSYSARDGLDYVPYDNFPIMAHKGERVQTAREAGDLVSEIRELKAGISAIAKYTQKTAKILDRFDGDGVPPQRI